MTFRRAVMCRVTPFGQVTVPACSSTVKSSRVNPSLTAGRSGGGLMIGGVPGIAQRGPGLASAVGRVRQHLEPAWFGAGGDIVIQQRQPDHGFVVVLAAGFGQFGGGDQPGVRLDRQMGFVAVLAAVHALVHMPRVESSQSCA